MTSEILLTRRVCVRCLRMVNHTDMAQLCRICEPFTTASEDAYLSAVEAKIGRTLTYDEWERGRSKYAALVMEQPS